MGKPVEVRRCPATVATTEHNNGIRHKRILLRPVFHSVPFLICCWSQDTRHGCRSEDLRGKGKEPHPQCTDLSPCPPTRGFRFGMLPDLWSLSAVLCCPAATRQRRRCTWRAPSAGGRSGWLCRWPGQARPAGRTCATSTGSPIYCSCFRVRSINGMEKRR